MTIHAESWAWDAGVGSPLQRLSLVVLAEFADRHDFVNIPFDGFTYYCALRDAEVQPLLKGLEDDGFLNIIAANKAGIIVKLLIDAEGNRDDI